MNKFTSYINYINEKFIEDSDPIHDMGIGATNIWKKEYRKAASISQEELSELYFQTDKYDEEAFAIYIIMDQVIKENPKTKKEIQKIFNYMMHYKLYDFVNVDELDHNKIKEGLKNFYYIDVKLSKKK